MRAIDIIKDLPGMLKEIYDNGRDEDANRFVCILAVPIAMMAIIALLPFVFILDMLDWVDNLTR